MRGSSFLEEVGESSLPPPSTSPSAVPAAGAVVAVPADQVLPEDGAAGQERATSSAEAQILSVRQVPVDRRDNSPPTSDLSTGKMNPRAPGWNKRLRIGAAAPSRPPCPNRVSAFEKAVRSYAENPSDNVVTPVIGMTFGSVGEAYDFYNLYSWEKGFGIRYGKSRLNVERTKCMQEIVCGCSGKAGVENTRSCRCECPALIRLLRAEDNGWYIAVHRDTHNHSLSPNIGETVHWPSHKHIDVYTRDLVKQHRQNNVNLAKVYSIIGGFFGSMENVPFTKRSLCNLCGKINRDHAKDDVKKTMDVCIFRCRGKGRFLLYYFQFRKCLFRLQA